MNDHIFEWCWPTQKISSESVNRYITPRIGQLWRANQDLRDRDRVSRSTATVLPTYTLQHTRFIEIKAGEKVLILRTPSLCGARSLDFLTLDHRYFRIYYDHFCQAFEFIAD